MWKDSLLCLLSLFSEASLPFGVCGLLQSGALSLTSLRRCLILLGFRGRGWDEQASGDGGVGHCPCGVSAHMWESLSLMLRRAPGTRSEPHAASAAWGLHVWVFWSAHLGEVCVSLNLRARFHTTSDRAAFRKLCGMLLTSRNINLTLWGEGIWKYLLLSYCQGGSMCTKIKSICVHWADGELWRGLGSTRPYVTMMTLPWREPQSYKPGQHCVNRIMSSFLVL